MGKLSESMRKVIELLPLQFRILFRQFLLRVVDLEALSVQADVPRFLGQFASILIFISLCAAAGPLVVGERLASLPEAYLSFAWGGEQTLISGLILVIGLVIVITWDSTFPDRRDVMVLAPLPVRARTILIAKVAASASLLGLTILTLNFATGIAWPFLLGSHHESAWGYLQSFAAYWLTMIAASTFLYCAVLTVQGFTALVLPRRIFLGFSAFLQLAAFGIFLSAFFLQPSITTPAQMEAAGNHWVAWSPSFWFLGLFNQLNGTLPRELRWLALRAWVGLVIVMTGAVASLLLCYLRTMRRTVEEPDLVPGARGWRWTPRFGSRLDTAIVLFSLRSLMRSRQHRVAMAFYLAVICSIALWWLRVELAIATPVALSEEFLTATMIMMSLGVFGLRSVFSLPISLHANWMLRATQLCSSEKYVNATRKVLLFLAVGPLWIISALLALDFRPWSHVAVHLVLLALLGWVFVEVSLVNFYKVPFTCSYLPGKVHMQVVFWCFLFLLVIFGMVSAEIELPWLGDRVRSGAMIAFVVSVGLGILEFNRRRAKSAVLYFEELPAEVITTLGLVWVRPSEQRTTAMNGKLRPF